MKILPRIKTMQRTGPGETISFLTHMPLANNVQTMLSNTMKYGCYQDRYLSMCSHSKKKFLPSL